MELFYRLVCIRRWRRPSCAHPFVRKSTNVRGGGGKCVLPKELSIIVDSFFFSFLMLNMGLCVNRSPINRTNTMFVRETKSFGAILRPQMVRSFIKELLSDKAGFCVWNTVCGCECMCWILWCAVAVPF